MTKRDGVRLVDDYSLSGSQHKAAHTQSISSGRGWILFVAILQLLFGAGFTIAGFAANVEEEQKHQLVFVGGTMLIIGFVFLALWFWARSSPFPAALTALILYITIHAADAVMDPKSLANGLLIKILIILGLSKAVQSAYALRKQTEE